MKYLNIKITLLTVFSFIVISCSPDKGDTDYLNNRTPYIYFRDDSGSLIMQEGLENKYEVLVTTSQPAENDLTFNLVVDPESTAIEGVDYTIVETSFFITKGKLFSKVIVQGNIDEASTDGKTVIFNLESSEADLGVKNVFTLDLFKFCPFDRDDFLGDYDADEEGYTIYPVTITAGVADNEIIISNVWDADPSSTTSVFLLADTETLDFPDYMDNYLFDHPTYGAAYIDNGQGTFVTCSKTIDMTFQVRVAAGFFATTHITFTPAN